MLTSSNQENTSLSIHESDNIGKTNEYKQNPVEVLI